MLEETKGLVKRSNIIELENKLNKYFANVESTGPFYPAFYAISFTYKEKQRMLSVGFDIYQGIKDEYANIETWLALSFRSDSVEIMKIIINAYGGGFIDENSCDNEDFYLIGEIIPESFEDEVIRTLGVENLRPAMELFEKFKNKSK